MEKSKVYYCKEITSENLIKMYEVLGVNLTGKVGVKVSTGEKGSRGYLKADLIAPPKIASMIPRVSLIEMRLPVPFQPVLTR